MPESLIFSILKKKKKKKKKKEKEREREREYFGNLDMI
jgi:hypothetical protein